MGRINDWILFAGLCVLWYMMFLWPVGADCFEPEAWSNNEHKDKE